MWDPMVYLALAAGRRRDAVREAERDRLAARAAGGRRRSGRGAGKRAARVLLALRALAGTRARPRAAETADGGRTPGCRSVTLSR